MTPGYRKGDKVYCRTFGSMLASYETEVLNDGELVSRDGVETFEYAVEYLGQSVYVDEESLIPIRRKELLYKTCMYNGMFAKILRAFYNGPKFNTWRYTIRTTDGVVHAQVDESELSRFCL